mgnify:CR=1 FL=1
MELQKGYIKRMIAKKMANKFLKNNADKKSKSNIQKILGQSFTRNNKFNEISEDQPYQMIDTIDHSPVIKNRFNRPLSEIDIIKK